MHPYREPPKPSERRPQRVRPGEETILAVLVVIVGGLRVLASVVRREPLDGDGSIALLAVAIAAWCLMPRWWRRLDGESPRLEDAA